MRDRKADNLVRKQLWREQCAWGIGRSSRLRRRGFGLRSRRGSSACSFGVRCRSRGTTSWIFAPLRCASRLGWMAVVTSRVRVRMRAALGVDVSA